MADWEGYMDGRNTAEAWDEESRYAEALMNAEEREELALKDELCPKITSEKMAFALLERGYSMKKVSEIIAAARTIRELYLDADMFADQVQGEHINEYDLEDIIKAIKFDPRAELPDHEEINWQYKEHEELERLREAKKQKAEKGYEEIPF